MTHTICNQAKPSLSVRTRALTSKHHTTKSINRWTLIRTSTSLRLRHRNASFHKSSTLTTPTTATDHVFTVPTDCPSSTTCTNELQSFPVVNSQNTLPFSTTGPYFASSSSSSASSTSSNNELLACKWEGCEATDIERTQLVNHLQQIHVLSQVCNRRKYFACLWRGCRVYKQPSVSATWLEQHVLHHTDAKGKPFRCIFDACAMRFSSSTLLERHVQRAHIRSSRTQTGLGNGLTPTSFNCSSRQPGHLNSAKNCSSSSAINLSSAKSSELLNPMIRKSVRRKKRPRGYRVRRIDYYDNRSRTVIQNRLKIIRLLSNQLNHGMDQSTVDFNTILPSNLPLKLSEMQSKPRLRSASASPPSSSSSPNHKPDHDTSTLSQPNLANRRKHISLLLTIPHTFVGQRLCEDQRTEFLVRWTGGSAHDSIPPTWILEDELLNALRLERQL